MKRKTEIEALSSTERYLEILLRPNDTRPVLVTVDRHSDGDLIPDFSEGTSDDMAELHVILEALLPVVHALGIVRTMKEAQEEKNPRLDD